MRVLHVYKTYLPDNFGGVEQSIRQLSNGMSVHGIESDVFTLSTNPEPKALEFESHHVFRAKTNFELLSTPFSFEAIRYFRKLVQNYDIIHYHYPYPYGDLLKLLSGVKKPSIVTYHSDIVRQKISKYLYAPIQKYFLNSVDHIICTSLAYKKSSKVLQNYKYKTTSISLGLSQTTLNHQESPKVKAFKNQLPEKYILYLGVVRNYKGIETLLKSAKGFMGNLVIAGGGVELEKIKNIAKKNKLNNVMFTGRISDQFKNVLLQNCSGLVLPSNLRSEAFGLVLLEASMQKKPLISTDLDTGTSYVNQNGKTGIVVSPNDVDALRNALNFFHLHPEIASQMGHNAYIRYKKLFTAEKMCEEYNKIYRNVYNTVKLKSQREKR